MGLGNSNKVSTNQVLPRTRPFVFSNSHVQGGRFLKLQGVNHLAMQKKKPNQKKPHQTPNKIQAQNHQ